jgi:hypothetical protein
MKKSILTSSAVLVFAACAVPARAQENAIKKDVIIRTGAFGVQAPPPDGGAMINTFAFVSAEAGIPGKVVKGAPYTATAVTETVQALADGNRITNTITASLARDSEGRTRREQSLPAIGPWASDGAAPKMVTINDTVSGVTYVLDDRTKTARKLAANVMSVRYERKIRAEAAAAAAPAAGEKMVMIRSMAPGGEGGPESIEPKLEQLGQRNIEGLAADGVRTTMTLPAGAVGNERPLAVVDERWYSAELQATVMSKHSDPRMGETTFRMTNVSRSEPSPSLFEVPADYKIVEAGKEPVEIKMEKR